MKTFKNTNLSIFLFMLSNILNFSASATDRYEVIEYGESGHYLYFKMSEENIKKNDTRIKRVRAQVISNKNKIENWVQVFEFGESGHILEFPMSDREVEEAKMQRKRSKEIRPPKVDTGVEVVEMADGYTISFEKSK